MISPLIEDWQYIKGTGNVFVVSDRGRIGEILRDGTCGILRDIDDNGDAIRHNKDKYATLWLCNTKKYVHVEVAKAFIPNPDPNKFTSVHHKDHNSLNNCVTNLEWTTPSYNNRLMHWNKKIKFNWRTLEWINIK